MRAEHPDLPQVYAAWQRDREQHLLHDLAYSDYTADLYARYRRQLGPWRFVLLRQVQALLVPERVGRLLDLKPRPALGHLLRVAYRPLVRIGLRSLIRRLLLPREYFSNVQQMDEPAAPARTARTPRTR